MAWTAPITWAAGAVTAAMMQAVSDNQSWLKAALATHGITSDSVVKHVLSAGYSFSAQATDIACPDTTDKGLPFAESDEEWKDVASMHSDSAKQSFIAPVTGRYHCTGNALFDTDSTGWRAIWFEHEGSTNYNRVRVPAASGSLTGITTTCEIALTAGDALRLFARQNSGGSLDCDARFQVRLVSV